MKLISVREQARTVADRWAAQYDARWPVPMRTHQLKALRALDGETATPEEIEAIIGNNSWCCPQRCHGCDQKFDILVEVGEPRDVESSTAQLCLSCLRAAVALAESAGMGV